MEIIKDSKGTQLRLERSWLANGLLNRQVTQLNGNSIKEEDYTYDVRNRLVEYHISGSEFPRDGYGQAFRKQMYEYDALNNLLTVETTLENYQVDVADYHYENHADPTQLTSVTHSLEIYPATIDLQYDTCGRMTVDEAGRNLSYDAFGRLVELEGAQDSSYQYNANNQLVNQTVAGDKNCQLYYRAGELVNQVLVEEDKKVRWIKSGASCLAVNDDQDVTLTANGQNESLLWSVKNSDSKGELHQYGAYGQGEAEEYLPAFNGERKDPISGHYHLGNGYRSYSPVLMRFTCPDSMSPFGAGGINAYAYCAGDPINLIDPSGHSAMGTAGLFSGGAVSQGLSRLGAGGGIALGIFGIVSAVATFGASVAAMGVAMASISLTLSLAAEATGIASIATAKSNPELSAKLGWASLGLGIAGSATGAYSKPTKLSNKIGTQSIASSIPVETFLYKEFTVDATTIERKSITVVAGNNYDIKKPGKVVVIAHGSGTMDDSFTSSLPIGFHAREGEDLLLNAIPVFRGEKHLTNPVVNYSIGQNIPEQILSAPIVGLSDLETGMVYDDTLESSIKRIKKAVNKNPDLPYAVAFVSTDNPMMLSEVSHLLESHFTQIEYLCCR
ncbi:RHS repeat-associated core domain-containing protein [Myroides odoratus DSM 2801]|nr:RHS repeat-associated core domain-containing protein [Myroides odoratus DSM 2801]